MKSLGVELHQLHYSLPAGECSWVELDCVHLLLRRRSACPDSATSTGEAPWVESVWLSKSWQGSVSFVTVWSHNPWHCGGGGSWNSNWEWRENMQFRKKCIANILLKGCPEQNLWGEICLSVCEESLQHSEREKPWPNFLIFLFFCSVTYEDAMAISWKVSFCQRACDSI